MLNGSLDDRGADYAVLVVAIEENVPARTQSLVEYEGNKLIVAVDREEPERHRRSRRLTASPAPARWRRGRTRSLSMRRR